MTRILIFIFIMVYSNTSFSQLNYNDFRGKWQERSRAGKSGNISFQDTLQLDFFKRDTVILRNGYGVSYRGAALFDRDTMYASAIPFKVIQVTRNRMILQDSSGKRTLVKVKRFHHENLGIKAVPTEDLSDPKNISMNALKGTWDIYRTEAAPGIVSDSAILRKVKFNNGGRTEIHYQLNGEMRSTDGTLTKKGNSFNLKDAVKEWTFHIYKAGNRELVFGNHGGIVYFAKKE